MTISIAITAHNEEDQLAACLASASFADEIVVLLDRCTDDSKAIALQFTQHTIEGAWAKEGDRRNLVLQACTQAWIFELDADECISDQLKTELLQFCQHTAQQAHMVRLHNYIGDRLVQHGWGPTCFGIPAKLSLFPNGTKLFDANTLDTHIPYQLSCPVGPTLQHPIIHHREKNISEVLRRLDSYTTLRAREWRARPDKMDPLRSHIRRFFTYFYKSYVRRKGYKEGVYGLLIALCAALYFPLAYIKAQSDDVL